MADGSNDVQKKNPLLTGWMVVLIVAVVGLVAIGITALATQSSTSSSVTTTTKSPVVQTTAPTTTIAVTTTTASLTNFVGTWSMHDGGLVIAASGAGTVTVPGLMYGG